MGLRWLLALLFPIVVACSPDASSRETNRIRREGGEHFVSNQRFDGLDAAGLLAHAAECPDSRFVRADASELVLIAHRVSDSTQTAVRVPLKQGHYVLLSPAILDKQCPYSVVLNMRVVGEKKPLVQKTFSPGTRTILAEPFEISEPGKHLEFSLEMAPDSTGNENATVIFYRFRIVRIDGAP